MSQVNPVFDDRMRRFTRIASSAFTILLGVLMLVAGGATHAVAAPVPVDPIVEPPPPADSFYDKPANLATFKPGDIIRTRPVQTKVLQLLPLKVQAWQLLYRSTDQHGAPDAVVTTVMTPVGPAKARPLLSYQAATDSTLRVCGPSYSLTSGAPIDFSSNVGALPFALPAAEVAFALAGLTAGWTVALPDHGGVENRFLTPRQPGFAVLDGIRAAENFQPAALAGASTPVALWGYSGGAIASTWAIEEQPTYAPELNIKGAAYGAPERDLEASLRSVNGALLAGLIPIALSSIAKDSPEFGQELAKYMTPEGKARVDETRQHCFTQNVLSNLDFRYETVLNAPIDVVLANPIIRREIDARSVTSATKIPTVPSYVYNGITEEVAPIVGTDKLVDHYCKGGAPVTYRREEFPPLPIPQIMSTHGVVVATGASEAFNWLRDRLAPGAVKPTGCDIQTVPSTILAPGATDAFGPFVNTIIGALTNGPIGAGG